MCLTYNKTFWNFISAVTRHNYRTYLARIIKIWNAFGNVYKSYKIFIESIYLVVFE